MLVNVHDAPSGKKWQVECDYWTVDKHAEHLFCWKRLGPWWSRPKMVAKFSLCTNWWIEPSDEAIAKQLGVKP